MEPEFDERAASGKAPALLTALLPRDANHAPGALPYPVSAVVDDKDPPFESQHLESSPGGPVSATNGQLYREMQSRAATQAAHVIGISAETAHALSRSIPILPRLSRSNIELGEGTVGHTSVTHGRALDRATGANALEGEPESTLHITDGAIAHDAVTAESNLRRNQSTEQIFTCTVCRKVCFHNAEGPCDPGSDYHCPWLYKSKRSMSLFAPCARCSNVR
jgi:hypothetical protein